MADNPTNLIPPRSWLSDLRYDASYMIVSLGMALGFSMRAEGTRHVPRRGPALLIANHQSFLDPILVGLAAGRQLWYLARKTLFQNPLFAWLIRTFNAVPIDQDGVGKEGIRMILELLRQGRAVVVFPEGERTPDGKLQPLKPGVHLLLKRTEAPIVPVGIAGAFDAWPKWRKFPLPAPLFLPPRPGTIALSIGRRLDSAHLAQLPREDAVASLQTDLQRMMERAEKLRRK